MALVREPVTTEKKIAASRRNGGLSRGPVTREGKERIARAHRRPVLYAPPPNAVLNGLGEDPAEFDALLAGLRQEFCPTGALQEQLVKRLARTLWQMDRAHREQEGAALARAKSADRGRANRLHARMMRLKMTAGSLQSLARSVAAPDYVTPPKDLTLIKSLQTDPELGEMGEIALALFCQLQDPGALDEAGRPVATEDAQQKVLIRIKEIFGLNEPPPFQPQPLTDCSAPADDAHEGGGESSEEEGSSVMRPAYPHITAAQWEAREPVRQLLENILTRQAEHCEALRQSILKEMLAGPTPDERAAEIAPHQDEAIKTRRMQDAHVREVRRLTDLLLKLQRREDK